MKLSKNIMKGRASKFMGIPEEFSEEDMEEALSKKGSMFDVGNEKDFLKYAASIDEDELKSNKPSKLSKIAKGKPKGIEIKEIKIIDEDGKEDKKEEVKSGKKILSGKLNKKLPGSEATIKDHLKGTMAGALVSGNKDLADKFKNIIAGNSKGNLSARMKLKLVEKYIEAVKSGNIEEARRLGEKIKSIK